jgi:hypothetical protein
MRRFWVFLVQALEGRVKRDALSSNFDPRPARRI